MKTKMKKGIAILAIILVLINFMGNYMTVFATNEDVSGDDPTIKVGGDASKIQEEYKNMEAITKNQDGENFLLKLLDGIVGIFTILSRLKIILIGTVGQSLGTAVAKSAGTTENGNEVSFLVTPSDILFNNLKIVDVNFFDVEGGNETITEIRKSVVNWYVTIRYIAIISLLCILIYIGIRMAMSTVAEQRAIYKKMLVNWFVSFILVFVLHYIMLLILNVNSALVSIMNTVRIQVEGGQSNFFGDVVGSLVLKSFWPISATVNWGAALVYIMVIGVTLAFLIMYIKRVITIAFLIIIAPIITITYSIDKVGDDKSQALNTWLKEFAYNILIQPFHCIIYMVFVSTALTLLNGTLAGTILAVIMMSFVFQAEAIVRKIFGFEKASSLGTGLASMAAVYGGFKALKKMGGSASSVVASPTNPVPGSSASASAKASNGGTSGGSSSTPKLVSSPSTPSSSSSSVGSASSLTSSSPSSASSSLTPSSSSSNNSSKGSNNARGTSGASTSSRRSSGFSSSMSQARSSVGQKVGNMKDSLDKIDQKISSVPFAGVAYKGIKKGIKAANSPELTGGAVGLGLGMVANGPDDIGNNLGAVVGGAAVSKKVSNNIENQKQRAMIQRSEKSLSTAYNNVKLANGYDDKQMNNLAQSYMNVDTSTIKDLDHRLFAEQLQSVSQKYQNVGVSDVNNQIADTLRRIQRKDIKPRTSGIV